ncbi:MAG: ferrous iron transport protein A [Clostridia bacterium]|nr:ferrous iron transport protein A [Clostridia bacterium]
MNTILTKCTIGQEYSLVSLDLKDDKMAVRLQELGFVKGSKLVVKAISPHKKTVLVSILGSMFALKSEIASQLVVKR